VPNLVVVPKKLAYLDQASRPVFMRDYIWTISQTDGVVNSHKLLEYINKRTDRNIEHKEPIYNILIVVTLLALILLVLFALWNLFKSFFLNSVVQFTVSVIIYSVCMAGVVYNILNNTPFSQKDRNGDYEWFTKSGR